MTDQTKSSEGGIPEDCLALMKQLHFAALMGNFNRCMELQQFTNYSLKKHGLPAPEFPIEYFQLINKMYDPTMQHDQEKLADLGARLLAFQRSAGVEYPESEPPPLEFEFPEEYHELYKQAAEAYEREDWPEYSRLVKEAEAIQNTVLTRMGILNLGNLTSDP